MAVPFIYSPSTIISSSEMNTNLAFVDYTDIANDKAIQWRASGGGLSSWIKQDGSDHVVLKVATAAKSFVLRNNSDQNFFEGNTNTSYVGVLEGYTLRVYSAGNTYYWWQYHDGSNALYNTTVGAHIFRDPSLNNAFGITSTNVYVYNARHLIIHNSGNTKSLEAYHDGTNGVLWTSSGKLVFQPNANSIDMYADLLPSAANTWTLGNGSLYYNRVYSLILTTNLITSLTSGTVDVGNELRVTGTGVLIASYNNASTKRAYIQHDDSYAIFGASANHLKLQTAANGDLIILTRFRRRFQGTNSYNDDFAVRGSGYIQGDGSAAISRTHTFGPTFGNDNITVVGSFSGAAASAPGDEGDLSGAGRFVVTCTDVTTTNVLVTIMRDSGTFSGSTYYGYSLIAIGPL